jgi:hypothetical protein
MIKRLLENKKYKLHCDAAATADKHPISEQACKKGKRKVPEVFEIYHCILKGRIKYAQYLSHPWSENKMSDLSFEIIKHTVDLRKHGYTELPMAAIPTSPEKSPNISTALSED